MARTPRIPKYRRHSSGQARVTIQGKDHLLGLFGTAASREAYQRLIAEWLSSPAKTVGSTTEPEPITISEIILANWKFANKHYGFDTRSNRGDSYCLRDALKVVRSLYGRTAANSFGPLALKACRQKMIENDWSRKYINAQIDRVRRMFRWAAEEELLPGNIYQNLRAVSNLRFGKTEARETKKVRPVPQDHIDAALPFMPPTIRDMVSIQLLAGCRPEEICLLRPMDLDRNDARCWIYRPGSDQIEPKDDWKISPRIYMGIVGDPGSGKTPAINKIMQPLWRQNYEWIEEYKGEKKDFEVSKLTYEAEKKEFIKHVSKKAEQAKKAAQPKGSQRDDDEDAAELDTEGTQNRG